MAPSSAVGWVRPVLEESVGELGWPAVPRGTAGSGGPGVTGVGNPLPRLVARPGPAVVDGSAPPVQPVGPPVEQPEVEVAGVEVAGVEEPVVEQPTETSVAGSAGVDGVESDSDEGQGLPAPAHEVVAALVAADEQTRRSLTEALPEVDDTTPLGREVAEDARRRIALSGRRLERPPATRVLTVANQKGGVGKTTTTVNLAAALAQGGMRVLVLDSDPQGNASTALGIDHHAEVPGLYDVLVDDLPLEDVVQPCPSVEGLWCAPATIDLAGAEIELVSMVARENRLRVAVQGFLDRRAAAGDEPLDYVFVDCPPSLGLLTLNAFVCAREVLIPIQCEYYALEGLSQLLSNIEMITKHLNPGLHVGSILLTMYDARTRLAAQVADEVRTHFPGTVLASTVPRSVRVSEAPSYGQTVMTYDPGSSGALSYLAAAREIAERGAGSGSTAGGRPGTAGSAGRQRAEQR